jgi:hypothetical protein
MNDVDVVWGLRIKVWQVLMPSSRGYAIVPRPPHPQVFDMGFRHIDDEQNVLIEVNAQEFDAASNNLPIDFGGERLIFQVLLHALGFERDNSIGTNQTVGDDPDFVELH